MVWYLERIQAEHKRRVAEREATRKEANKQSRAQWAERLTPLEDRVRKLLAEMPEEVKVKGLSLDALRRLLAGKWRENCIRVSWAQLFANLAMSDAGIGQTPRLDLGRSGT